MEEDSFYWWIAAGAGLLLLSSLSSKPRHPGMTRLASLRSQAFPSSRYPGVLVHVPAGYDPNEPLDVVVYYRGFNSCVSAVAASSYTRCREGGPTHRYSDLLGQFDRSGVNAVLILPELRVEEATGDPGQLGSRAGFDRFLSDVVTQVLGWNKPVRRILLCAHSGGYQAAAAAIGPGVDTVCLFDALYGEVRKFTSFAARARSENIRFISLYTGGSTENNSMAMASSLRSTLGGKMLVDTSSRSVTWREWMYPVLIKRVPEEHSWIPLRYFESFLRSSGLPSK